MASNSVKDTSYYIHSIICIVLMVGIGFIPAFGGITELGMKVLGVFLGLLYGWIFVGFIWPSLFGMLVLGVSGYDTVLGVFQAGFGDATVLKIFFILLFASVLQATNLTTYIGNWCVSRKICRGNGGRPWVLTMLIFTASFLIGGFINQFGGIIIMWAIFYGIAKTAGFKKGDGYVSFMIVGIALICVMGSMSLPFVPVAIIYRAMLQTDILSNYEIPMGPLTVYHIVLFALVFFGYFALGKYILRLDVSPLKNLTEEFYEKAARQKMNKEQKYAMISLVAFVIFLLLPIVLPDCGLKAFLSNMDIIGISVIVICFFCFRRNGKTPIYNFGQLVHEGVNWDLIILFAATMPVSTAMESDQTGIVTAVVNALMPIFSKISPSLYVLFCLVVFILVTQVAHNLILAIVFTPVLATIGIDMGINPYMFQILFAFGLQLAFMTPGASANAAMVFGNTEWIDNKDAYKYTTLAIATCTLLLIVVGIPVGMALF